MHLPSPPRRLRTGGVWGAATLLALLLVLSAIAPLWLQAQEDGREKDAPSQAALPTPAAGAPQDVEAQVVYTKDRVKRPGIYIFTDYGNLDPRLWANSFTGGHALYEWNQIEPQEGYYNWGKIDGFLAREAAIGKPVGLAIHIMEGGGTTAPQWVFDAGVKKFRCTWDVPAYWDPLFLD